MLRDGRVPLSASPLSSPHADAAAAAVAEDEADAARAWALLRALLAAPYAQALLYADGLPGLRVRCFALARLLAATRPALAAHLEALGGAGALDAVALVPWLQTLFTYHADAGVPRALVERAWDVYLFEGSWKARRTQHARAAVRRTTPGRGL